MREALPLASLRRRMMSLFYEGVLLAAIFLVAGFVLLPWVSPPSGHAGLKSLYFPGLPERVLSFTYYVAVGAIYFAWFWSGSRRTLPMKTWRLHLVNARDGGPLSRKQALARYFAAWIGPLLGTSAYAVCGRWGLVLAVVNYAWALADRERQFLHDRLAGTRLVGDTTTGSTSMRPA